MQIELYYENSDGKEGTIGWKTHGLRKLVGTHSKIIVIIIIIQIIIMVIIVYK